MNLKKNIPNAITCGNLICGCLAIVQVFEGNLVYAAYFVGIALVLDFFDGFIARMLKVSSPIGKDLDSLADMVTFGVVPGVMMFKLIFWALFFKMFANDAPATEGWTIYPPLSALPEQLPGSSGHEPSLGSFIHPALFYLQYAGFIITIFSCIRLAKFNNDTRQTDSFIGLPTPANTMVICSLPLISDFQPELTFIAGLTHNVWFLLVLSCVMSFLLVSEIPLFSLKFKNFSWKDNKLVYCFLIVSVVLIISLQFAAIPLIILFYIFASIVNNIFSKNKV